MIMVRYLSQVALVERSGGYEPLTAESEISTVP